MVEHALLGIRDVPEEGIDKLRYGVHSGEDGTDLVWMVDDLMRLAEEPGAHRELVGRLANWVAEGALWAVFDDEEAFNRLGTEDRQR